MNKWFYTRLAFSNIYKNKKLYLPYLLTCILSVMMFYLMVSLFGNEGIKSLPLGGDTVVMALQLGSAVVAVFACIFLFYTNGFLMKRRKKELGLYNILGMDKSHLARLLFMETLLLFAASLIAGCLLGILFDKLMFLTLVRMINVSVSMSFHIDTNALFHAFLLFGSIFLLLYLNSLRQIHVSKPMELLNSGNEGEREPKSKWIRAVLGIVCLGAGYYISITSENPVAAFSLFFVAVILVIIGTYLLFSSTSIAVLKLLRSRKPFYYKTRHFISISGMLYRMKQNAAGLANICVLSTMVLVMLSSTASLWFGSNQMLDTRYPEEINITGYEYSEKNEQRMDEAIEAMLERSGLQRKEEKAYRALSFSALQNKDEFLTDQSAFTLMNMSGIGTLFVLPLEDYNRMNNSSIVLKDHEVLLYTNRGDYSYETLRLFDETYTIKQKMGEFPFNGTMAANVATTHFMVVKDMSVVEKLDKEQRAVYGTNASEIQMYRHFDLSGGREEHIAFASDLQKAFSQQDILASVEGRTQTKEEFLSLFAGFFFIGIFLSVLFTVATILIIYYKQISEGYEDQKRFDIMQKVGLSRKEVKKAIHSQILTVFFLPLIVAGIHIAAAFPVVSRILQLFMLDDTALFIRVTVICFVIFSVLYAVVYSLTARLYYAIVKR